MPRAEHVEVLVLGSGAGGKLLASHMAKAGRRTAVVERKWIGGSCPNINCLPSKNEVKSAEVAHTVYDAGPFGTVVTTYFTDPTYGQGTPDHYEGYGDSAIWTARWPTPRCSSPSARLPSALRLCDDDDPVVVAVGDVAGHELHPAEADGDVALAGAGLGALAWVGAQPAGVSVPLRGLTAKLAMLS